MPKTYRPSAVRRLDALLMGALWRVGLCPHDIVLLILIGTILNNERIAVR